MVFSKDYSRWNQQTNICGHSRKVLKLSGDFVESEHKRRWFEFSNVILAPSPLNKRHWIKYV